MSRKDHGPETQGPRHAFDTDPPEGRPPTQARLEASMIPIKALVGRMIVVAAVICGVWVAIPGTSVEQDFRPRSGLAW
jgi:hypothetical protein